MIYIGLNVNVNMLVQENVAKVKVTDKDHSIGPYHFFDQ